MEKDNEQLGLEVFETNWLNAEDVKAKEITVELLAKPRVSSKGKFGPQMFLDVKWNDEEYVWSPTSKGAKFLVKEYGTDWTKWNKKLVLEKGTFLTGDGKKTNLYPKGSI